jgi:hypothetical protein
MIWRAVFPTARLLSKGHGPTNLFTLPIFPSVNLIEKLMGYFNSYRKTSLDIIS